jgi:hypothetical protein
MKRAGRFGTPTKAPMGLGAGRSSRRVIPPAANDRSTGDSKLAVGHPGPAPPNLPVAVYLRGLQGRPLVGRGRKRANHVCQTAASMRAGRDIDMDS